MPPERQRALACDTKATNELKMLVTNGKVNVSIPTALDSEQQQNLELLQKLSGKQFDKAFRNDEVQSHWHELYLAEQYAKSGDNADLKNWASINLPTLGDHLNKAEKLKHVIDPHQPFDAPAIADFCRGAPVHSITSSARATSASVTGCSRARV